MLINCEKWTARNDLYVVLAKIFLSISRANEFIDSHVMIQMPDDFSAIVRSDEVHRENQRSQTILFFSPFATLFDCWIV